MDTSAPAITLGSNLLRPRRSLARRWVIAVSLIVHAAAIGAYIVMGMLRVERLKPDRGRISVAVGLAMPETGGGPEPGSKPKDPPKPKKDKPKVQVDETVQPTTDTTKISTEGETKTTSTTTGTGETGTAGLTTGTDPVTTTGECTGEDCKQPETKVEKPEPEKPVAKTPKDFDLLRRTPDDQTKIQPSAVTKTAMQRAGHAVVKGNVKVCLDARGTIRTVTLAKSTGYADYDARLVAGVRTWEYDPAIEKGVPVASCGTVFFTFRMQ
jgi:TonB family protein